MNGSTEGMLRLFWDVPTYRDFQTAHHWLAIITLTLFVYCQVFNLLFLKHHRDILLSVGQRRCLGGIPYQRLHGTRVMPTRLLPSDLARPRGSDLEAILAADSVQ